MKLASFFFFLIAALPASIQADNLFDMAAIRDASTLEARVIQDWQPVAKHPGIRQKLIEITVCEWWPGQKVRLPVTLCVPEDGGPCENVVLGNMGLALKPALPNGAMLELLTRHGVGVVLVGMSTIDAMEPKGTLHLGMKEHLLKTKDPRYTPAWMWGMSDMRALTAAMAESEAFAPKKVIATGGSKRGVGASICGIHDARFTGIFPVVAPMLANPGGAYVRGSALEEEMQANADFLDQLSPGPNPLGLPDTARAALEAREERRMDQAITMAQAKAAGWSREDMLAMNDRAWEMCLIARHLDTVKARGLEFLYHVGTNDNVCPGLAMLGHRHPDFPVFILPGGQHGGPKDSGFTLQTPTQPEADENLLAFALHHFDRKRFPVLEKPPVVETIWNAEKRELTVTATFRPTDLGNLVGGEVVSQQDKVSWCVDRSPPYTYAAEYDQWESAPMEGSSSNGRILKAVIAVAENAKRVDLVTTHRFKVNGLVLNVSSPYSRWEK